MKQCIKKIIAAIYSGTSYAATPFPRVYFDADGNQFSGDSSYKLNLPATVSAANFWVISIYNGKNPSDHQHDQPLSSAGSLNKLNYNEDGTVELYFGPELPKYIEIQLPKNNARQLLVFPASLLLYRSYYIFSDLARR